MNSFPDLDPELTKELSEQFRKLDEEEFPREWSFKYVPFFKMYGICDERGGIAAWTPSKHYAEDIVKAMNETHCY